MNLWMILNSLIYIVRTPKMQKSVISATLDKNHFEWLAERAKKEERTISFLIRKLVEKAFEKDEQVTK